MTLEQKIDYLEAKIARIETDNANLRNGVHYLLGVIHGSAYINTDSSRKDTYTQAIHVMEKMGIINSDRTDE